MVGELIGKTEEDLLRIEGIGGKAIEELKAGLAERDLLYILETPKEEEEPDVSKLLEMVFSPEDNDLFMEGEVPLSYSVDPDDDVPGAKLQVRANQNDASELDELLGQIGLSIEEAGDADVDADADVDVDAADELDATELAAGDATAVDAAEAEATAEAEAAAEVAEAVEVAEAATEDAPKKATPKKATKSTKSTKGTKA
jgi:hypothetical protein